ncbi:MAG: hypothetical protein QXJ64_04795 [Thermosphaera sp.]
MVKCPSCSFESGASNFKQLRELWKFRFYEVRMLECPRCKNVFNYYEGTSPRGEPENVQSSCCKPGIAGFVEETLVGVDINPFAVEMAKLNLILAISDKMLSTCRASYVPSNIRTYWADSLAR